MAKTPAELEAEANAEFEALMQEPDAVPQEPDTPEPEIKEPATPEASNPPPTPPADEPKPADTDSGNWEERYKNLQAHTTKVNQEASDLRRQLEAMQQQLNQQQQSSHQTRSNEPDDLPEPDELDIAAQDFDELAPMVKRIKEQEAFIKELKAQRAQESQQREQQSQQDYYGRIAAVHADHQQIYQSPEFRGWIERLNGVDKAGVTAAFNQGSAEDVIEVFTRYKAASGLGNKHDQAAQEAIPSLRSRSQPNTTKTPRFSMAQIAKMSPQEYAKHEAEIDEAIMRGEVA